MRSGVLNFANKIASTLVREYVSDAGMGKFINGIYKSRGCMVGYIVQGNIRAIIPNINNKIVKTYSKSDCLLPDIRNQYKQIEIYKSKHAGKLNYLLYHIMLNFN
jgi:hypothetical protein